MIITRPRRRFNARALCLDMPLPIQPTCAGMRLSWPSPYKTEQPCPVCRRDEDACTCPEAPRWTPQTYIDVR